MTGNAAPACAAQLRQDAQRTFPACKMERGLRALTREHRRQVDIHNPHGLVGSMALDACYTHTEPQASRWDYWVGWGARGADPCRGYFVEFHQAKEQEVERICAKFRWVLAHLRERPLARWPYRFCWVAVGKVALTRQPSRGLRKLAQRGIVFVGRRLRLPDQCEG